MSGKKVAIIGSGIIGRSYAMLFASAGYKVVLHNVTEEKIATALDDILNKLKAYEELGVLKGSGTAEQKHALISGNTDLAECVKGAVFVHECLPERLELKKNFFAQLDALVDEGTILASATSSIVASKFTEELKHRDHCLVAHPANPPYFLPLVELVPAPWTLPEVVDKARSILTEVGQAPITLSREEAGFALNRIQIAILNECWRMAESGLCSVADINSVMTNGLGMRYAFLGPLETLHLNGQGFRSACEVYGPAFSMINKTYGASPSWDPESPGAKEICRQLEEISPLSKLKERRDWRDARLADLTKMKMSLQ